jgi:hypothetical protein
MKGKEIVKKRIAHASTFFLIPVEFISVAPFLMLRLKDVLLSLCSFLLCHGIRER